MKWTEDGWPQILPKGERVPYTLPAPKVAVASPAPTPLSGNFTWRDEFDSGAEKLAPLWLMLRNPHEKWWSLTNPKGSLSLTPRVETIEGKENPSFFGRRLQHAKFEASTALTPSKSKDVSAGLALFQSETHFYYLGVRRADGQLTVFLELANDGKPAVKTQATIAGAEQIELRVRGDELSGVFEYRIPGKEWQVLLGDADLKPITTNAAGGGLHFTGAVVGVYARRE